MFEISKTIFDRLDMVIFVSFVPSMLSEINIDYGSDVFMYYSFESDYDVSILGSMFILFVK